MLTVSRRTILVIVSVVWVFSVQPALAKDRSFPAWLGGKPDLESKNERCAVYDWFFNEADSQTQGTASEDDLASMRVINIANKLVDHHLSSPSDNYGAEIRFLVIGRDRGPFDFKFQISNAELERIMNRGCGD